jgi:type IV secretion system protein VirB10
VLAFAALIAGCGVFVAATWGQEKPRPQRAPEQPARQVVPFEPIRAAVPTLAAPGPDAPRLTPTDGGPQVPALEPGAGGTAAPADPAAQRRAELAAIRGAPILAYSRGGGAAAALVAPGPAVPALRPPRARRRPSSTCCGAARPSAGRERRGCRTATS